MRARPARCRQVDARGAPRGISAAAASIHIDEPQHRLRRDGARLRPRHARVNPPKPTPAPRTAGWRALKRGASIESSPLRRPTSCPSGCGADAEGIRIVDVRERSVPRSTMAHAHASDRQAGGRAGHRRAPASPTRSPAIATRTSPGAPVLVLSGVGPTPQENRGGNAGHESHRIWCGRLTRYAAHRAGTRHVLQEPTKSGVARLRARGGEPGPVYSDFPTETLRAGCTGRVQLDEHFTAKDDSCSCPDEGRQRRWSWTLVGAEAVVLTGAARAARAELRRFLDRLGAVYLGTPAEPRLVPDEHPPCRRHARHGDDRGGRGRHRRRRSLPARVRGHAVSAEPRFLRIADAQSR